jgi:hypothetical protein
LVVADRTNSGPDPSRVTTWDSASTPAVPLPLALQSARAPFGELGDFEAHATTNAATTATTLRCGTRLDTGAIYEDLANAQTLEPVNAAR